MLLLAPWVRMLDAAFNVALQGHALQLGVLGGAHFGVWLWPVRRAWQRRLLTVEQAHGLLLTRVLWHHLMRVHQSYCSPSAAKPWAGEPRTL
jgi:hypothetical protein